MDMPRRLAVSNGISAPALPAAAAAAAAAAASVAAMTAAAFAAARMSPAKESLPRPANEPDDWCEEDQAVEGSRLTERCRP